MGLVLELASFQLGNVDDSRCDLEIPKGARVTDLVNNNTYVNGRPFEGVVPRPASGLPTVIWVNLVVVTTIVSLVLIRRQREGDVCGMKCLFASVFRTAEAADALGFHVHHALDDWQG